MQGPLPSGGATAEQARMPGCVSPAARMRAAAGNIPSSTCAGRDGARHRRSARRTGSGAARGLSLAPTCSAARPPSVAHTRSSSCSWEGQKGGGGGGAGGGEGQSGAVSQSGESLRVFFGWRRAAKGRRPPPECTCPRSCQTWRRPARPTLCFAATASCNSPAFPVPPPRCEASARPRLPGSLAPPPPAVAPHLCEQQVFVGQVLRKAQHAGAARHDGHLGVVMLMVGWGLGGGAKGTRAGVSVSVCVCVRVRVQKCVRLHARKCPTGDFACTPEQAPHHARHAHTHTLTSIPPPPTQTHQHTRCAHLEQRLCVLQEPRHHGVAALVVRHRAPLLGADHLQQRCMGCSTNRQ